MESPFTHRFLKTGRIRVSNMHCDETSRKRDDRLRTAGHQHARAVRGVADRLLLIVADELNKLAFRNY